MGRQIPPLTPEQKIQFFGYAEKRGLKEAIDLACQTAECATISRCVDCIFSSEEECEELYHAGTFDR